VFTCLHLLLAKKEGVGGVVEISKERGRKARRPRKKAQLIEI